MWQLYKYQPINKLVLSNLAGSKLWFAKPNVFNDPFEFRIKRDSKRGLDKLREENPHLENISDENILEKVRKGYEQKIREMGVCCFTEVPDSIQMWAYYADAHRGICLGFSGKDKRTKKDDALHPVYYKKEYPEPDYGNVWHLDGLANILFTKEKAWEHEKEYRRIIVDGNKLEDYTGTLNKIIFGIRTIESDKALIQTILSGNKEVKFYQVVRDKNKYKFNIEAI
ncbi:MAG: DUF2971 domain-containing protein [Candidatus Paceibacterota bacterium]